MYAVERLSSYIVRGVDTVSGPFRPFGGAVDIIVVQQPDGSFKSSPWYVRFGKFQGVLKTVEKSVDVCVNGVGAGFHMYLDHKGEAYFLEESEDGEGDLTMLQTSSGDEIDQKEQNVKLKKMESCEDDGSRREPVLPVEVGNGKIVTRTTSKRAQIMGPMFGKRSIKEDEMLGNMQRVGSLEPAEIVADLLEMKWSTNLPSQDCRQNKNTHRSFGGDGAIAIDDKEGSPQPPSSLDDFRHEEMLSPHGENADDSFATGIISTEYVEGSTLHSPSHLRLHEGIAEEIRLETDEFGAALKESFLNNESNSSHGEGGNDCLADNKSSQEYLEEMCSNIPCLRAPEEVAKIYTSETGELCDKSEVVSELVTIETDETDILMNSNSDSQKQALEERYDCLGEEEITSFSYCETLESTTVRFDDSSDKAHETLNSGKVKHLDPHVDVCNRTVELTSEVQWRLESDGCANAPNSVGSHHRNLEKYTVEDSSASENRQTDCQSNETSEEATVFSFSIDHTHVSAAEPRTIGICYGSEVSGQDKATEKLAEEKEYQANEISTELDNTFILLSKLVEDDELEFSKNDTSFCTREVALESQHDNAPVDKVELSRNSESHLDKHELKNEDHRQLLEGFPEVSRTETCPINIPKSKAHLVENILLVRSLPNIRTHIHDLERSDLHRSLSWSFSPDYSKYEKDVVKNRYASSSKQEASSGSSILRDQFTSDAVAKDGNAKEKETLFNRAVDLSLCQHLPYEGMGADEAHQTFAEKELIFEAHSMVAVDHSDNNLNGDNLKAIIPSGGNWRLWPFNLKRSNALSTIRSAPEDANGKGAHSKLIDRSSQKSDMKKALTPTSKQLASLNLEEGRNIVTFSFSTARLGRQQLDARIYLWKWNTRIVISDVDGTITKSDVLGQFMPLVGVDWSQTGVAHLFSAIKENGYQLLFLSARAISQAHLTRQFLFTLKQNGKALPDGAVVISPDGLFPSLYREVIRRAPHEFKISCLEDIRALFPTDCSPFYAGFGNRNTDEISYLKVGIPKGKIFIINPKGEIAVNRRVDTKSYTSLHELVNDMFPAMSSAEQEDFNTWNYWKLPLWDVDM